MSAYVAEQEGYCQVTCRLTQHHLCMVSVLLEASKIYTFNDMHTQVDHK